MHHKRLKHKIIEFEDENKFNDNEDNNNNNNNNNNNSDYTNDYKSTACAYTFYSLDEETWDDLVPEDSDEDNGEYSFGLDELDGMQLHREELRIKEVILLYLPC